MKNPDTNKDLKNVHNTALVLPNPEQTKKIKTTIKTQRIKQIFLSTNEKNQSYQTKVTK